MEQLQLSRCDRQLLDVLCVLSPWPAASGRADTGRGRRLGGGGGGGPTVINTSAARRRPPRLLHSTGEHTPPDWSAVQCSHGGGATRAHQERGQRQQTGECQLTGRDLPDRCQLTKRTHGLTVCDILGLLSARYCGATLHYNVQGRRNRGGRGDSVTDHGLPNFR